MNYSDAYRLQLSPVISGYDRQTCWVQARAGVIPTGIGCVVMTMQKLMLTGSDVFYELNEMRTDNWGKTWEGPVPHSDTMGRRKEQDGIEVAICDFCPQWHAASGKLLGTGHVARYAGNRLLPAPRPRDVAYSFYDSENRIWSQWDILRMPKADIFFSCGAGSAQRWDCVDGTILLPVYTTSSNDNCYKTVVVRCAFDGQCLSYMEHGSFLDLPEPRGLYEPSMVFYNGRYYLTMRNDLRGYVAVSDNGLEWETPQEWRFDHGKPLGTYNTQQHWLVGPKGLYLVYTRQAGWNDHVFRHRAPLFMAEVDTETLTIKRNTERIVIPERGARLGNFHVTKVSEKETWIIAAEWMQSKKGVGLEGSMFCEQFGSDNTIWVAR